MKNKENCPRCSGDMITQRDGDYTFYGFAITFLVMCVGIFWSLDSVIYRTATVIIMAACISYFESFRKCATCGHQWRWTFFGVFGAASAFKPDWKAFVLLQFTIVVIGVAAGMAATLIS